MEETPLPLLEVHDAAKILNCSPDGVRFAIRRGDIPVAAVTPRGVRLLARSAVEKYLERRAVDPRFDHVRARERNRLNKSQK